MLKNKIPLHSFVGINLLMLGILGLSMAYTIFSILVEREHQWSISEDEIFGVITPTVFGAILLFTGLGLLLKMKWARISVNVLLIITFALTALAGFFTFYYGLGRRSLHALLPMIGVLLFSLCTLLSIFFFINNTKVVDGLNYKKDKTSRDSVSKDD